MNLHVQISWQAQHVLCEPPCADLVAGTALCCLPRDRMYALASAGHRRLSADFVAGAALCEPSCADLVAGTALCEPGAGWAPALDVQISWQAQHFVNLHMQISWQALCEPSCADLVAGTALCEPPCALCAALAACQGVGCTPWRRLGTGALPVAFACCVRRLLLAKGLASAGHRRLMCRFRGRRSTV